MYNFKLTEDQTIKLAEWVLEQDKLAIEHQKKLFADDTPPLHISDCWDMDIPYYGAINGNLTFSFTPTSIGIITVVKNTMTNNEIDLTDYESW